MSNFKSFDKSFNRTRNFVIGGIVAVFILIVCFWIFIATLGLKAYKTVDEKGLKSVVERIWDGKELK